MGKTLIDMIKAIIFEENIVNDLCVEIILIMTQIKNIRSTYKLKTINFNQILLSTLLDINHL